MKRDDALLLIAVVAPGKYPAADEMFARVTDEMLKAELQKNARGKQAMAGSPGTAAG